TRSKRDWSSDVCSSDLLDNIPDNIYFKDTQSRFTKVGQALGKKFGLQNPEEAVGKTDFDFFTPEHAKVAFDDEQFIIRTGQPIIDRKSTRLNSSHVSIS